MPKPITSTLAVRAACGSSRVVRCWCCANILATPLKVLAPLLCAHVTGGWPLVLPGILERQADEVKAAYAPYCTAVGCRHRGRLDLDDRRSLICGDCAHYNVTQ